jgi:hypothetical protein
VYQVFAVAQFRLQHRLSRAALDHAAVKARSHQHSLLTLLQFLPLLLLSWCCAPSTSGHVVLGRFPTGQKMKTLLQSGPRAGCLSFAATQPSLLCGAKGSGQLVVWDITQLKEQRPEEYNVHRVSHTAAATAPARHGLCLA